MAGEEKQRAIAEMKELAGELEQREDELAAVDRQWGAMQLLLPSIPLPQVPVGKDDTENREVRTWGRPPDFDFPPKDHVTLGHELDIIDIPRGVKIAGSRSYFLKGDAVRLELAVLGFTLASGRPGPAAPRPRTPALPRQGNSSCPSSPPSSPGAAERTE